MSDPLNPETEFPAGDEFAFEFERKFFVESVPPEVIEHGSKQVIVQAYVFAKGGYAVRVRVAFRGVDVDFPKMHEDVDLSGAYERRVLAHLMSLGLDSHDVVATVAVKSPSVNGERYEMEVELDTDVAVQILRRSSNMILKKRYSLWYNEDGWEFDVFGGQNEGLIIAEIERLSPVVDLKIPEFCITEVTGEPRFTNDSLSKEPWTEWDTLFRAELADRGPYFMDLRGNSGEKQD